MCLYIYIYAIPPIKHHCAIIVPSFAKDKALAVLGSHTFSDLPPGFETRASQSKPGQLVYLDLNLGWKWLVSEGSWLEDGGVFFVYMFGHFFVNCFIDLFGIYYIYSIYLEPICRLFWGI